MTSFTANFAKKITDRRAPLILGAVLAGIAGTPASSADLGASCCADLEERIAELEATTARKGNRKVSLEVSGHVNQGLLYWDDGFESNAGVYTNDNSRTRFRFRGKAKINADWEAGYRIEVGVRAGNSKRFTQEEDNGQEGLDLRDSHWFIKSKTFGQVSVGLQGTATDQITETNLTQTESFAKYADIEDTGLGLSLRNLNGLTSTRYEYRRLIGVHGDQPGEGERRFNVIKYASPELAGFSVSASWGEDDFWDAALRYEGEFSGFKVEAGIGYGEITDGKQTSTACTVTGLAGEPDTKCSQFGGSISVIHVQSGLFVNFGAGQKKDDLVNALALFAGRNPDDTQTFWAVQAGIEKEWSPLGATTIYGEYYDYDGGANNRTLDAAFAGTAGNLAVLSTGVESWGLGIAQGLDAAAMTLYLSYRHVEGDISGFDSVNGGAIVDVPLEDLDLVFAGAIIRF